MKEFLAYIEKIKASLQKGLPGKSAQLKFAPPGRKEQILGYLQQNPDFKTACVMLLIYPFESETRMVLIERTDGGNHAGQIGLPGGKMELDETHIQTAIRETYEEIGVSLGEKDILSPLTEIYIPPSNYLVHPFVSFLMYKPVFVVNETEVKRIIELPLHLFLEESVISEKIFINSQGTEIKTPCYEIGEVQIWGATSMIISEFISMIKS